MFLSFCSWLVLLIGNVLLYMSMSLYSNHSASTIDWGNIIGISLIGILLIALSAPPLYRSYWHRWLRKHGQVITANVTKIYQDRRYRIGRKDLFHNECYYSWIIEAEWTDTQSGNTFDFISPHFWQDPGVSVQAEQVKVFIHPHKRSKYWMDLSFLPENHICPLPT